MQASEQQRARDALYSIPSDCDRATWVKAGMAAHAAGLSIDDFDQWSQGGGNYNAQACKAAWRSFKDKPGGVGVGSLFALAKEHGYTEGKAPPRPAPTKKTATPIKPTTDPLPLWARFEAGTNQHEYIVAKGATAAPLDSLRVVPEGDSLRINGESMAGALAVPCFAANGAMQTIQFIAVAGAAESLKAQGKPTKLSLAGAGFGDGWHTVGNIQDGQAVAVCEGLGTAWAAWKATGRAAVVTFGFGRTKAVATALRQRYPSAHIVLCPDSGKEAEALTIAAAVGASVAAMPEGWPTNSDLHDLAERDGLDVVAMLLDSASVVAVTKPEPRFKLLNCNQLRDLPPLAWRVKSVFPDRGLAAIAGPSASGKSFLAFDLAAAIAGGNPWFGCRVEAVPVVYAALEGEGGFKLRAAAWEANRGQRLPDGLHLMLQPFRLTDVNDVQDLAAVVPAGAVVIVDTLNRAAPTADENSSRDMGEILEAAKRLQALIDGLVILVHHTGKDESKGLRGHSSLFAALDAAVTVKRDGDRREWALTKSKDGADGHANPFKLLTERLGIDDHGDPLTSCVIAPSDEPPMGKKPKRMGECEGAVVEYLASAKVGVRKADVVKHFEGRYEKGPIYRAMKSLATAFAIHEAAGMVCIANAAK
jgi:hypothetical protein